METTLKSKAEIISWILNYMSTLLDIPVSSIDINVEMADYGLDSSASVSLVADLEEALGRKDLSASVIFEHPSIDALASHLAVEEAVA